MKYGIIYKLKNLINGKEYVGQTTKDFSHRLKQHINEKRNRHVTNAIRTYGIENFEVDVLCTCFSKESLNNAEIYFVNFFQTMYPNGYNHRAGGDQKGICSEETKRKISLNKKGKPNLKRRGEVRSLKQRLDISRTLGGQKIVAVNLITKEIKYYETVTDTKKDGHNPSNVVQICKNTGRRKHSKNWTFYYEKNYANQNGSVESNISSHVQRLELETAIAE